MKMERGGRGTFITDLDQVANWHAKPWREKWGCHEAEEAAEEITLIRDMRRGALEEAADYADGLRFSPRAIRSACGTFAKDTAIGVDGGTFKAIREMPDNALIDLGAIVHCIVAKIALPPSTLLNILGLLGKKGGGSRTIAIMASLYRLTMRLCGDDVADWDEKRAGHWDTAVAGSSALRAHLLRALDVELAVAEGLAVSHFPWDMEQFYDSIRMARLIPQLKAHGYPEVLAALGLVAHRAPRVISTGTSCSDVLEVASRSIIAGCQQSVSWARALLHRFVETLGFVVHGSICFEHVGDLSQVVAVDSKPELLRAGLELGRRVRDGTRSLDICLSGKSVLLPAGDPTTERIASELRKEGVMIRTCRTADDLGVGCTAGRGRTTKTMKKRLNTAAVKASRIHRMAKVNKTAAKLAGPGVIPTQSCGHQAQGVGGALMSQMRRNVKKCTHMGSLRGCTTTTIWWCFGAGADPAVRLPLEQLAEWQGIWAASGEEQRRRIRRQWMRMMPKLIKDHNRWRAARGPMSATICTIRDIGWKPAGPAHWRVNTHLMAHVGGTTFAKAHILMKAQGDIMKRLANAASTHDHGKGISDCILLNGARRAKKLLVAEGDYAAAAAIDYVVTGVYRDPPGIDKESNVTCPSWHCPRCGETAAKPRLHELCDCPDIVHVDGDDHEERNRSRKICEEARRRWDVETCLWARGITPSAWVPVAEDIDFENARVKVTKGFTGMLERTRTGYSDGSGGDGEPHTTAARTMCGAATFECTGGTITAEGLVAETPGRQTVPRAEVWGAALLIERAPTAGPFRLVLDAAYVRNGIERRGDLLRGPNGDLWGILFALIDCRGGDVETTKVKSHVADKGTDAVRSSGFRWGDILGNELADAAAGTGHALLAGATNEAEQTKRAENYTVKVARRLGRIQARIWKATAGAAVFQPPEPPEIDSSKEEKETAINELIHATAMNGHRLKREGDGLRCSRCRVYRGWRRREEWTKVRCLAKLTAEQQLRRVQKRPADDNDGDRAQESPLSPPTWLSRG